MTVDIHSLSGAYAVDAVDDAERAAFEQHLAGCPACQQEVAELRAAAGRLAADSVTPAPPSLRASVLRAIAEVRPLPPIVPPASTASSGDATPDPTPTPDPATPAAGPDPAAIDRLPSPAADRRGRGGRRRRRGFRAFGHDGAEVDGSAHGPAEVVALRPPTRHRSTPAVRWVVGIAAALLVIGGLAWVTGRSRSADDRPTAADRVLAAADAHTYRTQVDGVSVRVVVSESLDQSVVVADDLADPSADEVYQAWYQRPGEGMVAAGQIAAHDTTVLAGPVRGAEAIGITVEPAAGSPEPTSDPVALVPLT